MFLSKRCRNCVGWHESIDPRITPIVGYDGEEFPDPPEAGFVPSAHSDTGFTVGSVSLFDSLQKY